MEAVVSFLALLELIKRQVVDVNQDEIFGDILLKKKNKI
jgi:chromatin segregation and condensation protein Rec8/ScpA/Scc1 (kleisin family)